MARPVARLFVLEAKMFLREPAAVLFSLAFPILLVLVLGAAFGSFDATKGYRVVDLNAPALMAVVIANLALLGLPINLTDYKERGILRRYRASPVSVGWLLIVLHLVSLVMFAAGSVLVAATTAAVFGLRFGGNVLELIVVAAIAATCLNALGFALGGILATTRSAQAVGFALFFPMLFLSGAAFPTERFPDVLRQVSDFVPLTYVVEALTSIWTGESVTDQALPLAGMVALTAVAAAVARRTFRWG